MPSEFTPGVHGYWEELNMFIPDSDKISSGSIACPTKSYSKVKDWLKNQSGLTLVAERIDEDFQEAVSHRTKPYYQHL